MAAVTMAAVRTPKSRLSKLSRGRGSFVVSCASSTSVDPKTVFEGLLVRTEALGSACADDVNVVAFSGGVDSSLVACLVQRVFPHNTVAMIGRSPSLSLQQLSTARGVAGTLGVRLVEVDTAEQENPAYVHNTGDACLHCKRELYQTLRTVANESRGLATGSGEVVVFNGTNADDLKDLSRLGIVAAQEFQVKSPLESLSKTVVREVAKYAGLPNHNLAAMPCLRSRLEYGVHAVPRTLNAVESAEELMRKVLRLEQYHNLRVRIMKDDSTIVEVDAEMVDLAASALRAGSVTSRFGELGLGGRNGAAVEVREFRSGALSGFEEEKKVEKAWNVSSL